ncbi:hypothetical protein P7266_0320 [Lactococcus cremoris]|nr:hypothetical protein P7266_0320 [Lactococcus cremoris]
MLDVSTEFNEAMKAENRRFETRIKIGDTIYTKKDINNWVFTGGSISGETFQIGSTFSNSIKIEFCSIIEGIKELDEVIVEVGIATYDADFNYTNIPPAQVGSAQVGSAKLIHYKPTVYEYVPLGTFYVTTCDPDRNEKKTTLEASDRFLFMEDEYVSELKYPAKIRDVALEIANKSAMKINETNFSMISTTTIAKPEGYTYRQAIGLIAQFEAGYARFNRNNELEVKQLIDPKFSISPSEYFQKGLTKNELMYKVGGISCTVSVKSKSGDEQVTYTSGSNTGPQIVLDNKVMTQNLLDNIYQKVKDLNFYPFTLNWRGNPALEMGDWLTLTDRDGTSFKAPNLSYTLTFSGGLTAVSSANTNSSAQTVSAYSPPMNQIIKDINSRVDAAGKNSVYDGTEEPPYPKEGDIWFKKNGPDDEIWIYSKLEDGTYDWVMTTSTRLSDEIQEKIDNSVPSDEIVKTINLSEEMDGKEWLKISGAKIWLTDQTRIDDAIIKDAMIGSLSASKISAGTLDASTIDVINLNASNISTGTLSGGNLSMNLDTGAVQFQKGYIAGANSKIRFDLDKSYFQSLDSNNNGFIVQNGTFNFYQNFISTESNLIGKISLDILSQNNEGIRIDGKTGIMLAVKDSGTYFNLGSGGLNSGKYTLGFQGHSYFWGDLSVLGTKNAVHVTRDGVRATPAYETAESYLGDIGTAVTNEEGEARIPIDVLYSDTVNTKDYEYQVFLQAYSDAVIFVSERNSEYFIVKSSNPNVEFTWEIKAKRRGYENDRLVIQDGINNDILLEAHAQGLLGDGEEESNETAN